MPIIDQNYVPNDDENAVIQAIDNEFEYTGGSYHGIELTKILTDFYQIRVANWYGCFIETDGCARVLHLPSGTFVRLFLTDDWEEQNRDAPIEKWWPN